MRQLKINLGYNAKSITKATFCGVNMILDMTMRSKLLATTATRKWKLVVMHQLVLVQMRLLRECPFAVLTCIWPQAAVSQFVRFQRGGAFKWFRTLVTDILPPLSMRTIFMLIQFTFCVEQSFTLIAWEHSFTGMHPHVHLQVTFLVKFFVAFITRVMFAQMVVQPVLPDVGTATALALEPLLVP